MEKYPSWLKGLPWKGSRSLIAARGFKSLLLRSTLKKKLKKFLTNANEFDKINELLIERTAKKLKKLQKSS